MNTLVIFALAIVALAPPTYSQRTRAAATLSVRDCCCQCNSDSAKLWDGTVVGNCESPDEENGAKYCFVDEESPCTDVEKSKRFRDRWISYHACTTPPLDSYTCRRYDYEDCLFLH